MKIKNKQNYAKDMWRVCTIQWARFWNFWKAKNNNQLFVFWGQVSECNGKKRVLQRKLTIGIDEENETTRAWVFCATKHPCFQRSQSMPGWKTIGGEFESFPTPSGYWRKSWRIVSIHATDFQKRLIIGSPGTTVIMHPSKGPSTEFKNTPNRSLFIQNPRGLFSWKSNIDNLLWGPVNQILIHLSLD